MWYNQTTLKLRGVTATAAWSSGANLSNGRQDVAGAGTQNAGLAMGGYGPTAASSDKVEEYNGSGWASGTSLPGAVYAGAGLGTQTAALYAGGNEPPNTKVTDTHEYDGTTWTTGGVLGTARQQIQASTGGTQTAGIIYSGLATGRTGATEEYNGTSWSEQNDMNTARDNAMGTGSQTAAMCSGGYNGSTRLANSENYDGTSWTESGADLPAGRISAAVFGTSVTDWGIATGDANPLTTSTIRYDGTSWSETADVATARNILGGSSQTSPTAGLIFGGNGPPFPSSTEEFNFSAQVITAAAWSSGGNLSTGRQRAGGFGNAQNSAAVAAGATAPPASALSATEEYDGSAWSSGGSVNTARFNMTAFGTEPAGVLSGIGTPSVSYGGTTEEYNGSTWTTVNPYAAPGANYRSSCGPQTAGLLAGGVAPSPAEMTNAVEEYDGTNWTSGTTLPQYQSYSCQAGTQTAAINGGGSAGPAAPGPVTANTISLEYDGTNWTTAPNANLASPTQVRSFNGGTGTQSDAMFAGGDVNLNGIRYDGTTFATDAAYPAVRGETSAAGLASASNSILFAGAPVPGVGNTTVEYSAESTSVNSVDITTAE
jgi:hypothetical protein